jgi:hypothetical protein
VPFKCDGGRLVVWRESFVGITNEVAIEFLRRRVGVRGGGPCLLMVLMREGGREGNFGVY